MCECVYVNTGPTQIFLGDGVTANDHFPVRRQGQKITPNKRPIYPLKKEVIRIYSSFLCKN